MNFDISEIGQIDCTLNFDEDWYEDYLRENNLEDSDSVRMEYVKEHCDYDVNFLDSDTYHSMGYETMTYDEIVDEFGENIANAVLKYCMNGKEQSFELAEYDNETVDLNDKNALNSYAIKVLRHGQYTKNCRGFILTNGVVVYTDLEHNQCTRIPGVKGTAHFIELGNIRVLDHSVDLAQKPTDAQREVLNDVFNSYYGEEVYLDLMNKNIGYVSKKYNYAEPYEILNDISKYFNGRLKRNTYEITLKDIKYMVTECVKRLMNESASSILYHWINLKNLVKLLQKNSFFTCDPEYASYKRSNEHFGWIDGENIRFISFTRNGNPSEGYPILKYGEFGDGEISCMCRLTINGDMLNTYNNFKDETGKKNKLKVSPMDWAYKDGFAQEKGATNGKTWMMKSNDKTYNSNLEIIGNQSSNDIYPGYYSDVYHHPYSQAEDRLTTTAKYIPNANKYITRIDIYLMEPEENIEERDYIKQIRRYCKKLSIPLYFHKQIKDMLPYNTNKKTK